MGTTHGVMVVRRAHCVINTWSDGSEKSTLCGINTWGDGREMSTLGEQHMV